MHADKTGRHRMAPVPSDEAALEAATREELHQILRSVFHAAWSSSAAARQRHPHFNDYYLYSLDRHLAHARDPEGKAASLSP